MISVADLVTKLHSNIDQIHTTIASISDTSDHDAEITRLEKERDEQLQRLKIAHESSIKEGEEERLKQEQEIEEQIKREEEEIAERRRREDEERKLRIENALKEREKVRKEEEEKRKVELENRHKGVEDGVDEEMERLEDELEKRMTHGQKALEDLDAARREINRQIDQQLNVPTVLPKIQYKSRKKAVLNIRKQDTRPENQEVRELEEDDRNNLDTNDNSTRDTNEDKDKEPQDNKSNVADNEKDLELEQLKEMEMQPSSPSTEEFVHREQELRSPEVEHVEEISQPIEETAVSIPEERHVESDLAQQPENDPLLENHAQEEHAQEHEKVVKQPIVGLSKEILKDQTEETPPSVEISQSQTSETPSEELDISNAYAGERQAVEIIPEIVENELIMNQDRTSVEIPKEVELSSPYDQDESPADRAAREEIAKLNEEIRQAMNEEVAGAMIPHEEAKDLTYDASEEESTNLETPQAREVVMTDNVANEAAVEKKDITEDGLPKIGTPKLSNVSEIPSENGNIESKIIPETVVAENALENEVVSEINGTDDKEVLEPEEQAKDMTQDRVQITPEVPSLAEKPSSEYSLHIDSTTDDQKSSENNTSVVDESPDQTRIEETEETPPTLREMAVLPTMTIEESTPGNFDGGIVEAEDESLAKEFPSSDNQEAANKVEKEPEMVVNDQKSVHEDEPTTLKQSEPEELQTALRKSAEAETIQLNESPLKSGPLSENQLEIYPNQEKDMEIMSVEDNIAENVPKLAENFNFAIENAPTMTGEKTTSEDPSVSNLAEDEGEAKAEEVVPNEDPTKQNKELEKQSGTDLSETKFEDNNNSRSNHLSEPGEVTQSPLDEGEIEEISDGTFLDSNQTSEVVDSETEIHEDHISPINSRITTEDHAGINEVAVSAQDVHHFKDASIDTLTKSAPYDNSNHELDLTETRDVTDSDISQDVEPAVEPVLTIIEQIHDDQEDANFISKSDEVETGELEAPPNKSVLKVGGSNDSEQIIPEAIDESIQLPGHVKHLFDEPLAANLSENEDSSRNEPVVAEEEEIVPASLIPNTGRKDIKTTDQRIEPSLDITLEELQPNTAGTGTPEPQEFEGIGGASLNLDVGSPLPSPTHQKVAVKDGENPQLESDFVENQVNSKEIGAQEEDPKIDDSAFSQDLGDEDALSSIRKQSENNSTSPENLEIHEIKGIPSNFVEKHYEG
ncbi:hypothetical protein EYC80_001481 [Monilinia laxa]|uniref:Uncharacterized protein n=1 Tax=Monilinia laxa TaxID=61186 RepID=A0A5N6K529_MONLA|nr:hypothetical protein EYC80_001481 [Monilinia laxa]